MDLPPGQQGLTELGRSGRDVRRCFVDPSSGSILLQGQLRAGKTSLVQGLAQACGITEPITSPTFALAQHSPDRNPPLIHLDLYRLDIPGLVDDLFLQEEEEARAIRALMAVE